MRALNKAKNELLNFCLLLLPITVSLYALIKGASIMSSSSYYGNISFIDVFWIALFYSISLYFLVGMSIVLFQKWVATQNRRYILGTIIGLLFILTIKLSSGTFNRHDIVTLLEIIIIAVFGAITVKTMNHLHTKKTGTSFH